MNLNKVIIIGRISSDVRVYTTQSNVQYTRFTVAVNRRSNQNTEITDFIRVVGWRGQATFIGNFLQKGDLVSIEGYLQSSEYNDKNGNKVRDMDVVIENISPLETKEVRENRRGRVASTAQNNNYSYNNNYNNYAQNNNNYAQSNNAKGFQSMPTFANQSTNNVPSNNLNERDWTDIQPSNNETTYTSEKAKVGFTLNHLPETDDLD
ncbi:single-stranded DNA-binding protein [Mycoplasmopsis iners]|uniref:single-stranded DNA-binding protein n=1 Tax=Mycoplasmopsis iners TaxID=76630 RepID=UPI000689CD59|nr:single-stranded DNA-binding protein [Mycoplasmopsis iners]